MRKHVPPLGMACDLTELTVRMLAGSSTSIV